MDTNSNVRLLFPHPTPRQVYVGPVPLDEVDTSVDMPREPLEFVDILFAEAPEIHRALWRKFKGSIPEINLFLVRTLIGTHHACDLVRNHQLDDMVVLVTMWES